MKQEKLAPLSFVLAISISNSKAREEDHRIPLSEQEYGRWSYLTLASVLRRLNPSEMLNDLHELYRRMVFNILVNNDDDHPRNHGFLLKDHDNWQLAPLFDVVPRNQLGETFRLAMTVGAYGKDASIKNAISACDSFELTQSEAKQICEELESYVEQHWRIEFRDAGLKEEEIESFAGSIGRK